MIYRTREEEEMWKAKDPIPRFEAKLKEMGVLTEAQAREINERIIAQVEEAVRFAEESPWPAPEEVLEDVYTVAA